MRATKMIPEMLNKLYEKRLESMGLPSLAYRRMRGDVIEMYKYIHNIYKVPSRPFQLDNDESRRNNGYKLVQDKMCYSHQKELLWEESPEVLECTAI